MKDSTGLQSQALMVSPLEGKVQNNDDIQQVYDDACLNVQGCCRDIDLL